MIGIKNSLVSAVQRVCGYPPERENQDHPLAVAQQNSNFFSKLISLFLNFLHIFWTIFRQGSIVSLMYTFSFMLVSIGILINRDSTDEAETAAVAPITTMLSLFFGLFLSPLFAVSILVSGYLGEIQELKNSEAIELHQIAASEETESIQPVKLSQKEEFQLRVGNMFRKSLGLSAALTPFVMLPLLLAKPLLVFLGQSIAVATYVAQFTMIFALAALAMFIRVTSEQIAIANDRATPMMGIALFDLAWGTALAIILGRIMGIPGIAIACTAQIFADAFFDILYLYNSKAFKDFKLFNFRQKMSNSSQAWGKIGWFGGGIAVTTFSQTLTTFVTSLEAGLLPAPAQSIWGVILTVLFFFSIPTYAFGAICAKEVSHDRKAKNYQHANQKAKYGLLTVLLCILIPCIALGLYPQILTVLLSLDETISASVKQILPIMLPAITADALRYNLFQQLRALDYEKFPTIVSFLGMLLSVVTTGVGFKTDELSNVAWGYLVASLAQLFVLLLRWLPEIQPSRIQEVRENKNPPGYLSALSSCVATLYPCRKGPEVTPENASSNTPSNHVAP